MPWALAALLLAALLGGLALRARLRWDRAVARLRSEPGIVLTQAERDGGRWRFAGLRDPLAPDPAVLLAGLGVDTGRVEQRWEPYLSLRPELVLARARRSLAPPAGVKLALTGDTLRATGSAPLDWVASVGRRAVLAPRGVGTRPERGRVGNACGADPAEAGDRGPSGCCSTSAQPRSE